MQNLNRQAVSGIPRTCQARNFKLMRSVVHCEPVRTGTGSPPASDNSCSAGVPVAENVSRSWTA